METTILQAEESPEQTLGAEFSCSKRSGRHCFVVVGRQVAKVF